ncbi:hypothetical protein T01_3450 [Trichinella spiralis]|uniref:Uncharacterized protein n=1 Tax=Trichinella spiralis TaxID=6334 RepID=A0A0V1ATI7_TRISP|nr:hypothetical protein T01_3450 [Trichinella spiralis]
MKITFRKVGQAQGIPTHLKWAKQQSLTHLFHAESIGFLLLRDPEAWALPAHTVRCLSEGSFTLQRERQFCLSILYLLQIIHLPLRAYLPFH